MALPIGIEGNEVQIQSLRITVDGKPLEIPAYAYQNLIDPMLSPPNYQSRPKPMLLYQSLDGRYLYLYTDGSNAAGSYFAKLVFDHERFITQIVAPYYVQSMYGTFGQFHPGF